MKSLALIACASLSFAYGSAQAATRDLVTNDNIGQFLLQHYPPDAIKQGAQGRVNFRLSVAANGLPTDCTVTKSSGFASLDQATCEILTTHASFRSARDDDGHPMPVTSNGFVDWRLSTEQPQLANAPVKPTLAAADTTVCKVTDHTGSLIAVRVCKTTSEWADIERESKSHFEDKIGKGYACGVADAPCPQSAFGDNGPMGH